MRTSRLLPRCATGQVSTVLENVETTIFPLSKWGKDITASKKANALCVVDVSWSRLQRLSVDFIFLFINVAVAPMCYGGEKNVLRWLSGPMRKEYILAYDDLAVEQRWAICMPIESNEDFQEFCSVAADVSGGYLSSFRAQPQFSI